mgnify:CR=1 FL=1
MRIDYSLNLKSNEHLVHLLKANNKGAVPFQIKNVKLYNKYPAFISQWLTHFISASIIIEIYITLLFIQTFPTIGKYEEKDFICCGGEESKEKKGFIQCDLLNG